VESGGPVALGQFEERLERLGYLADLRPGITPAAQKVRDGPDGEVVGAFWLKSTKTRSPRSSFHQSAVIRSGWRRASSRASATAAARTVVASQRGSRRM